LRTRTNRLIALGAVAAITLAACGDDSDGGTSATTAAPATTMVPATTVAELGTIVDVAVAAGDFTTLVAAVEAAGLVETLSGPGPFTVFAPTDEAFAAALEALGLTAEELLADTETLTSILTYHVIAGEVPASAVVTMDGQSAETVNGAEVTISVDGDAVMVNEANVTAVDIAASNGIIHVIDAVLLPPADDMEATETTMAPETTMATEETMAEEEAGTIVDVAIAAGDFTTLVAAVEAAGLVETLSGEGPFTVFAPTDDAFAAALEALGLTAEELLADTETLTSILTYHVIAGEVPASAVVTMDGQSAETVNGAEVTISVDGDAVMVNDANVIAVDVEASNGIIHVIDAVLLPPEA
jgi:transforming growth factor-beta-induced protein